MAPVKDGGGESVDIWDAAATGVGELVMLIHTRVHATTRSDRQKHKMEGKGTGTAKGKETEWKRQAKAKIKEQLRVDSTEQMQQVQANSTAEAIGICKMLDSNVNQRVRCIGDNTKTWDDLSFFAMTNTRTKPALVMSAIS